MFLLCTQILPETNLTYHMPRRNSKATPRRGGKQLPTPPNPHTHRQLPCSVGSLGKTSTAAGSPCKIFQQVALTQLCFPSLLLAGAGVTLCLPGALDLADQSSDWQLGMTLINKK